MSQTAPPGTRADLVNGAADYDALAELFLGDDRPPVATTPAVAARPPSSHPRAAAMPAAAHVEGLVLGHLPVMASAWVQQYARHIATQHHQPVALLRLRPGEAQLDLIGSRLESPRPYASLEDAIREAASSTSVWIVRVDEVTEPRLTEFPEVSTVTLLTGADEAAVVSAYRTLKNLFRPSDDAEAMQVRIAIMGATPEKAAEASLRLEGAARAFLGRPIQIDCCISRIGSRPSAVLFRGTWSGTVEQVLQMLKAPGASPPRQEEPAAAEPPPARPAPSSDVVSRLGHVTSQSPAPVPVPAPSTSPGPCGPLASHIPGLRTAGIQCPYAPQVELALDERGVMHALGRLEAIDLSHLLTAAAWLKSHQSLLRMALPAHAPASEDGPVLHLFTADARRVRPLGDSPVRLHLLARVEANGSGTWFSTPLN